MCFDEQLGGVGGVVRFVKLWESFGEGEMPLLDLESLGKMTFLASFGNFMVLVSR